MPLRVVPSPTGLPSKRCPGIGFLSRADRKIGVVRHVEPHTWLVSNFLLRPASSGGLRGTSGTPCRQSMGIDPSVAIRRGEGAHRKWCRELWCFPRVRPVCQGTLGVASRVPSTVLYLRMERGTFTSYRASLVAQRLKRLPAMQETWVRSPGQEDPLEKEIVLMQNIHLTNLMSIQDQNAHDV